MWLARLTQWGMLRPGFVPPAVIRRVRDFTRARTDLVRVAGPGSCSGWRSCSKTAMIKITSVARDGLKAKPAMAMVAALAAGERDPRTLADLAKGPLRAKKDQLAEALDGMFDSRHGVIAQMLLDQVAFLDQRIKQMEDQAIAALAQVEESWGVDAGGETGPGRGTGPDSPVLAAAYRLAGIPGISVWLAIVIIAGTGLNMALFPTPAHLVSGPGRAGPPASPAPGTARASRRKATATPAPPPGRPPSAPPAPPPSPASGTPASPAAAARPSPRSPWPGPS